MPQPRSDRASCRRPHWPAAPLILLALLSAGTALAQQDSVRVLPRPPEPESPQPIIPFVSNRDGTWYPVPMTGPAPSEMPSHSVAPPSLHEVAGRYGHTIIFDPVRQRFLLFGGFNEVSNFNDVWERPVAGTGEWTGVGATGIKPPARRQHAAVYDPIGDRMVIYGGLGNTLLSDVWYLSLSGTPAWHSLLPTGTAPLARLGHSAVMDVARNRMIVFGGRSPNNSSETWVLTFSSGGAAWSRPTGGTPPPARYEHVAIADEAHDRMVIYGGVGTVALGDVWTLSLATLTTWTRRLNNLDDRQGAGAVYDAAADRMLVYGGASTGGLRDDWWEIGLSTFSWGPITTTTPIPAARRDMAVALDPVSRRVIIHGGTPGSGAVNDTWSLDLADGNSYARIYPPPPPTITSFSPTSGTRGTTVTVTGTSLASTNRVTFNGTSASYSVNSETEIQTTVPPGAATGPIFVTTLGGTASSGNDFTVIVPTPAITSFSPSNGPVGTLVTITGGNFTGASAVTFGGTGSAYVVDFDTRIRATVPPGAATGPISVTTSGGTAVSGSDFTVTTPPLVPLTLVAAPGAQRYGAAGAFSPSGGRYFVAGGDDGAGHFLNDFHELRIGRDSTWAIRSVFGSAFSPRYGHSIVLDPGRNRLLMFGGYGGSYLQDLWEIQVADTIRYLPLAATGTPPPPRDHHSAIYDPVRDRVIVFGGNFEGIYKNDLWALNLSGVPAWQQLAAAGSPPSPRVTHRAVYDSLGDRMLVFGGYDTASLNDLWALSLAGTPTWARLLPTGALPGRRHSHSLVYDPGRRRLVLFGGLLQENGTNYGDLWELPFSGAPFTWQLIPAAGTPPTLRHAHLAFLDSNADRMLISGGYSFTGLSPVNVRRLQWGPDIPTAATMALISSEVRAGRVELRWNVQGSPGDPCRLERHDPDGDWRTIDAALLDGSGQVAFADRDVVASGHYGYRLAVFDGGVLTRSAEVWLQVPGGAELALRGFSPNPAGSEARVAFSVLERSPVSIEVLDVAGRRVARRVIESPEPGPTEMSLGGEAALQPGLYFIRLRQGSRTLLKRGSIVR